MALLRRMSLIVWDNVENLRLTVHLQVDFNVPLDSDKKVTNTQRIAGAVPTIKYAIDHGAKAVILMSHLGRPDGKVQEKYSLKAVVPDLEKLLGKKVEMAPDCVGPEVEAIVNKASDGQVVLLENLRFHIEEEGSAKNADGTKTKAEKEKVAEFRKGLTALGDIYISGFSGNAAKIVANESQTMLLEPHIELTAPLSVSICHRRLPVSS